MEESNLRHDVSNLREPTPLRVPTRNPSLPPACVGTYSWRSVTVTRAVTTGTGVGFLPNNVWSSGADDAPLQQHRMCQAGCVRFSHKGSRPFHDPFFPTVWPENYSLTRLSPWKTSVFSYLPEGTRGVLLQKEMTRLPHTSYYLRSNRSPTMPRSCMVSVLLLAPPEENWQKHRFFDLSKNNVAGSAVHETRSAVHESR